MKYIALFICAISFIACSQAEKELVSSYIVMDFEKMDRKKEASGIYH